MRLALTLGLVIATLGFTACDDDTSATPAADTADVSGDAADTQTGDTPGDQTGDTSEDVDPNAYLAVEPPAPGEMVTIEPAGETLCSRGTPYRFFVFGGSTDKVVIDFQGGGACWNKLTCSIAGSIFSEEAPTAAEVQTLFDNGDLGGIYRLDDDRNPFKGWTLIHIPYCTGDIHWGNATVEYSSNLTIHHRGLPNTLAVLEWAKTHFPELSEIMVTGCSAGGYGAIGHAARIAKMWPNAELGVLGDSAGGIITEDFFQQSFPNWNAEETLPTDLPGLAGLDILDMTLADLYVAVANAYPNVTFGQYSTARDNDQTRYFTAMGGDEADWAPQMLASLEDISSRASNFKYYLAPGPIHCVNPYDLYYERNVDGTAYTDWIGSFMSDQPTMTAACEGDGCVQDPACDACAVDDSEAWCHWCSEWPPQ